MEPTPTDLVVPSYRSKDYNFLHLAGLLTAQLLPSPYRCCSNFSGVLSSNFVSAPSERLVLVFFWDR